MQFSDFSNQIIRNLIEEKNLSKKYFLRPQVTGRKTAEKRSLSFFELHIRKSISITFFQTRVKVYYKYYLKMKIKIGKSQTQDQVYLEPGSWRPAVQQASNLDRSFIFDPIKVIFGMILSFVYMYHIFVFR